MHALPCHVFTASVQGYSGDYCEFASTACDSNPCQYGGTCHPQSDGYMCTCPAGAAGINCETDVTEECQSSPCQNKGICEDRIGTKALYFYIYWAFVCMHACAFYI